FGGLRPHRYVAAARKMIAVEIPGAVPRPILVQREPFVQCQADAGGGSALDLARHQLRYERVAALENGMVAQQRDLSAGCVDHDLGQGTDDGVVTDHRVVVLRRGKDTVRRSST